MKKKGFLNNILLESAAILITILSFLIFATLRKKRVNHDKIKTIEQSNSNVIYAFWHGRLFPMGFMRYKKRKYKTIISNHQDGEIIAKVLKYLGVGAIRGSVNRMPRNGKKFKNRGGSRVIRNSIEAIKNGYSIVITPDGPKGPERKFKTNSLKIAQETNSYIIPVSYSCSSYFTIKSWDKFIIPKPFSKLVLVYGDVYHLPENIKNQDLENHALILEQNLNNITAEADLYFNNDNITD